MFLVYDRSEHRLPGNPAIPPPDEARPVPRANAALVALLRARQEDSPIPGKFESLGIPPASTDPAAGPGYPWGRSVRSWEENEFRAPFLWQPPGAIVDEDLHPRLLPFQALRRPAGDEASPTPPKPTAIPEADHQRPHSHAVVGRLARCIPVDEFVLSPKTAAPVVIDETPRRIPPQIVLRRADERDVWLPAVMPQMAYYTSIDILPTWQCSIDFSPSWFCIVTLAPGT